MVTSWKRFIINQDKRNSAVTQLTDNVAKPISIPSSLQQEKETPTGVQKITQNQPWTPNGSISAPDKSNTQLRLEYKKQQMADKARDIKESVVSNAESLWDSLVSGLSKTEEKVWSEVAAAAATKFTMNASEVEEAARTEAWLLEVGNRQAQEWKPRVESEFSRMLWDTSKLQEPFNLKLWFSPSPFKTWYLNFLWDEVSLTNGTSSITKPVIKTIDYESVLWQAYDTITYKAANEQEIMTVESFDELFPEYKDVPYDQKQIFINECLYDVQQGKKRDINEFADFFGSMSMKEGYVNQQDATIQYLTDSDVAKYSLNAFIWGTEALEWRTPEQIKDYIEAAYTIKAYADEINKQWYNVTDSAWWTIVKSFADDFEDLNQAIKTFENFNLTNTEAYQINNLYEKNLRTQNELINDFVYWNEIEQHNALKQFEDQYLYQFHKDYVNSFIREVTRDYQKDMEWPIKSSDWNEFLMWLYQDYYEIDGRRFNKDGEEILHSEWRDWFLNKVADGFIWLASEVETLWFDTAIAQKAWKESDDLNYQRERTMDVLFDTVNVAFSWMMEFTWGWQLFQFATTLWRAWAQLDWLFAKTMEWLWFVAEGMANMIWFTDWRSPESKEKYKQAMEWIWIMLLWRLKNSIVKRGKAEMLKYLDETAMMKALKAYVAQTAEWLEVRDGGKVKEVIKNKGKAEEKKWEPKTRKEVEQKAKTEKKAEENISEEENQKGAITLKQWTQENALKSFREIFDEEIQKINAEWKSQKIIDTLFQAASSLADRIFTEKTGEKEAPKETVKAPEIASESPIEWKTETITTEAPESRTQQTETPTEQTDIETTPETPEVKVEETKTGTPEIAEWVAETETKAPEETKTTVAKILDIIQKLQDNARWLYDKLTKPSEEKKIRQREIERLERADELLNRMWDEWKLDKSILDKLENNRATDEIMRIVDRQTDVETDTKGRPKNVTPKTDEKLERDLSKDDVEREVLSSWLERMQQYVDNIKSLLKKIWEVYDKLSKEKNIDSMEFIEWDILRNLLDKYNLKIEIEENEKWEQKAKVSKKDNVDTTAVEEGIVKYVEDFINKTLKFEMKSEADVQADRTKLTWNEDTYWKYDDGFENEFRKAFNDFLDTKADQTELLRKLDEQFSNLKENLEAFDDFMNKKGEMKNSAKNKILKLRKEDLAQLEQILPGITKLVELTKISYDLVSKVKKAKMQYKDSNLLRGHWVRYMWVMAASNVAGYLSFWLLWIPLASLAFVALERLWTAGKRKVSPKELDRSTYSKYVDLLKVEWNEKAEYKQWELERIKKQSEILKWKKEAEVQQTLNDAMEILIKRKANELIQQKAREEERERRVREREDRERKEAWDKSLQPIDNALPGVKPDVVTPEWDVTLGRGNPISPAPTKTNKAKPITEVKETYRDKEKTQKGYSEAENKIIETALWLEEKEYSKDSEKLANVIEESVDATSRIMKKDAINKLEEKGEDVTKENIAKEAAKEPSTIEDFIREMNETSPEEKTNYDGADIKDLEKVVANPKRYPNVDIEAAKSALDKARKQNRKASVMQSPDQIKAQTEKAWVYKADQMEKEHNSWWERQKEETVRDTNRDPNALETTEEYDRIDKQLTPESWELATKYSKWYKGFYRADKDQTDKLRADMGKKPSQNITYTSSVDKIQTLENPTSRKRVAQQRIDQKVDPNIKNAKTDKTRQRWEEEKTQLTQIIEQANVEIQAKEERKAQKTELANKYKALDKKRSETPYKETKKEITKEMNKISKEFDKVEMEEWEAEREVAKMGYEENMEIEKDVSEIENETPQKSETEIDDTTPDNKKTPNTDSEEIIHTKEWDKGEIQYKGWTLNYYISPDGKTMEILKLKAWETRRWIGTRLLQESEKIAKELWIETLDLLAASEKNVISQEDLVKFYEKNWFNVYKAHRKWTLHLMSKDLSWKKEAKTEQVSIDDIEYNKSTNPDTVELEVYKWVRGYGIVDTPWDSNTTFYTNDKARADQYSKKPDAEKQTISLDKSKVKIIDSRGIKRNQKVDENGNNIEWQTSKKWSDNYIDYNNRKAAEEWYDAVIYRGITDIGPYVHKGAKIAESADDIVLLKKGSPKTEETKKPEPNKPTWWTPLVDVAKDGTVNKEPGLLDYTTDQIQRRIDELKKKRLDNWKKLYAQDLSELRVLQDLLKRQIKRENREEWGTELSERQREILNSNNYGDQYRAGWAWTSED